MDRPTTKDIARFFDKVQITNTCWWWKITKGQRVYGQLNINGKTVKAHRFSYMLFVGPIELGKHILHKRECGNRSCVNPLHLYMGTHQDNMDDKRLWGNANNFIDASKLPDKFYSSIDILKVSGAVYYRLDYLINSNQVTSLGKLFNRERLFSQEEALKAVWMLRDSPSDRRKLQELQEKA